MFYFLEWLELPDPAERKLTFSIHVDKNLNKNLDKNPDKNLNRHLDKNLNKNLDKNLDKYQEYCFEAPQDAHS